MINATDLSIAGRSGAQLVDAIWKAFRDNRRDLHAVISLLIDHEDPVVREEALSVLLVKWTDIRYRRRAAMALIDDPDFGVRARAALGLASVCSEATRGEDIRLLLRTLCDSEEDPETRRSSYEALFLIAGRHDFPTRARPFEAERDVDWSWVDELRLETALEK